MTDIETKYRDSLLPVVKEYVSKNGAAPDFDESLVYSVPISAMSETVEAVEGIIARYDFDATIKVGSLYSSESKKQLARWLAAGGTETARDILAIRQVRDGHKLVVWKLAEADVPPSYLAACLNAGIWDTDLIAQGARGGLAIEYLQTLN